MATSHDGPRLREGDEDKPETLERLPGAGSARWTCSRRQPRRRTGAAGADLSELALEVPVLTRRALSQRVLGPCRRA